MSDRYSASNKTARYAPARAIMAISREFDKVAREYDMSIALYRLLLFLKDGPRRAGEVAATSLVTRATISGHISALREKEWISVELEPHDRRVTRIVLTDAGRMAMENFDDNLLVCLGNLIEESQRERLIGHLGELYFALSATRDTRYADLESPTYKFLPPGGDSEISGD